jgi:hypothetical protein
VREKNPVFVIYEEPGFCLKGLTLQVICLGHILPEKAGGHVQFTTYQLIFSNKQKSAAAAYYRFFASSKSTWLHLYQPNNCCCPCCRVLAVATATANRQRELPAGYQATVIANKEDRKLDQ